MQTSNQLIPYYALELDNPQHNKKVKQKRINTKWSNGINKFFHNSSLLSILYIFIVTHLFLYVHIKYAKTRQSVPENIDKMKKRN